MFLLEDWIFHHFYNRCKRQHGKQPETKNNQHRALRCQIKLASGEEEERIKLLMEMCAVLKVKINRSKLHDYPIQWAMAVNKKKQRAEKSLPQRRAHLSVFRLMLCEKLNFRRNLNRVLTESTFSIVWWAKLAASTERRRERARAYTHSRDGNEACAVWAEHLRW